MEEIWKDIKNYEGIYQISNLGRVKRIDLLRERFLKDSDNGYGYKIVGLCKNNKRVNHYIYRLVANAFLENINNYKEINHIDNNPSNNKLENLEWCDRSYNVKYSYDKGKHIPQKIMQGITGYKHPISKPVKQYDLKGNFIKEYGSANLASLATGICYMSIKKCRCNKQKQQGIIYGYKLKELINKG